MIATLNGLFMVPVANTASDRVDKALSQLESFLGLNGLILTDEGKDRSSC